MPKCDFNKVADSEHFFLVTPVSGCFYKNENTLSKI